MGIIFDEVTLANFFREIASFIPKLSLFNDFRDARLLSASELKRVTEIFTRMFCDAHSKVFTLANFFVKSHHSFPNFRHLTIFFHNFRDARLLSASELKRVTEIFTRMFSDAHTKVFALFLETLTELVMSHKADLGDWIYILITRLLNKLGADLLGE